MAYGVTEEVYAAVISNVFFFFIHLRNLRKVVMEDPKTIANRTQKDIKRLQDLCHGAAAEAGWWPDINDIRRDNRIVPTKLCLIHSEISEAMEGHRKGAQDDKLPHRPAIEVELADALIRIYDLAGALELDLGGALAEKMEFNRNRPDHKPENRAKPGGKDY